MSIPVTWDAFFIVVIFTVIFFKSLADMIRPGSNCENTGKRLRGSWLNNPIWD
jgi:hypothetical protein